MINFPFFYVLLVEFSYKVPNDRRNKWYYNSLTGNVVEPEMFINRALLFKNILFTFSEK